MRWRWVEGIVINSWVEVEGRPNLHLNSMRLPVSGCDLVGHKPTVYFVMIFESRLILSLYETQVFGELHGGRPGWSDAWVSPLRGPRHHPTQESTHAHEDHLPVLEKGQANSPSTPHGGWGYRIKNPRARTHWRQVPGVRTRYNISNIDVALHASVKIDNWNLLSTV